MAFSSRKRLLPFLGLPLIPSNFTLIIDVPFLCICENAGFRFLRHDADTINIPYHDITGEYNKKQLTEYF
jgi:hypothetical protein